MLWALFYNYSIVDTVDYSNEELNKLAELLNENNFEEAKLCVANIKNNWENVEKVWIYFVHQGEIDNIKAQINTIEIYVQNQESTFALVEIEDFKKLLNMVKGSECLSLENIF